MSRAKKDAERIVVTARAESERVSLEGEGQAKKISLVGGSEADVLRQKVASFGDGRLYSLSLIADALSHSQQPLVPTTVLGGGSQEGILGTLLGLVTSEKLGVQVVPKTIETTKVG